MHFKFDYTRNIYRFVEHVQLFSDEFNEKKKLKCIMFFF